MTTDATPTTAKTNAPAALMRAGVSLKLHDVIDLLSEEHDGPSWFEVHPEDFSAGPSMQANRERLDTLRERYPLSLHGLNLRLGAERDLDPRHLSMLREMVDRYEPCLFSEHLAWSTHGASERPSAMPPPFDPATLERVSRHIDQTQETLGREILLENPLSYIRFSNSTMTETDFLKEVVRKTGCKLLLDLNNAVISAANSSTAAEAYVDAFPVDAVAEIHLGGHVEALDVEGRPILENLDETPEEIWALYQRLVARIGPKPTLIEWDAAKPDWERLSAEAGRANRILDGAAAPA